MCFLCSCEGCFLNILPWWPTSRFLPVPGIVALLMTLVIASSLEYGSSTLVSKSEGEQVSQGRLRQAFRGSPSLIINPWFPKFILSRSVHSIGRVQHTFTSGNGPHSGCICLFELLTIHSVGIGALLCSEGGVFIKGDIEESACIVDGGVLCNEISDDLVKFLDCFGLDCTGFPLSFRWSSISTIAETRLALLPDGSRILAHVSQVGLTLLSTIDWQMIEDSFAQKAEAITARLPPIECKEKGAQIKNNGDKHW